uniref:Uncharacterized protein n=1 Tax=viral metagenome TaxID=1070528 RepID=A0A6C0HGS5_9ZZZZ
MGAPAPRPPDFRTRPYSLSDKFRPIRGLGGHDPPPQLPQLVFGVFIIVCMEFNLVFIIGLGCVTNIGISCFCFCVAFDLFVKSIFMFIKGISLCCYYYYNINYFNNIIFIFLYFYIWFLGPDP